MKLSMIKVLFIILFLSSLHSCKKNVVIHESYKKSGLKKDLYKKAIQKTEHFRDTYNKALKTKVNERFWKEFKYFSESNVKIDIIYSANEITQINIEKDILKDNIWNVHYTDKDTQLFLIELKNDIVITAGEEIEPVFAISNGTHPTISNLTIDGSPIIVHVNDHISSVALHNLKIKLHDKSLPPSTITSHWPGTNILLSTKFDKEAIKIFALAAENILNLEIRENIIKSKTFGNSIAHPLLKEAAEKIILKRDLAAKGGKEYPFWEFQEDIRFLNMLAKNHKLDENYVDNILNDEQYLPVSGNLLWYYSDASKFMFQWVIINFFFLVLIFVNKVYSQKDITYLNKIFGGIILIVNGWVISKKPDSINLVYWIIPGIVFLTNLVILNFKKILESFKK